MISSHASIALSALAESIGAELHGDDVAINAIKSLQNADEHSLCFIQEARYIKHLQASKAGAVIVQQLPQQTFDKAYLIHPKPYLAYAKLSALFAELDDLPAASNIADSSLIAPSAVMANNVFVGEGVVIEADVSIGANSRIESGTVIQQGSRLGEGVHCHPNVVIYRDTIIADAVEIHAGSVIGADGFGFAEDDDGQWHKIHQMGTVEIGEGANIGASSTIDRAAMKGEATTIGANVIIDNQVQIGHNVIIGESTAIAAGSLIAGSAKIGKRCKIAGGVAIAGHISLCDNVVITGRSVVTSSIKKAGVYSSGTALDDNAQWRRNAVAFKRLAANERSLKNLHSSFQAYTATDDSS